MTHMFIDRISSAKLLTLTTQRALIRTHSFVDVLLTGYIQVLPTHESLHYFKVTLHAICPLGKGTND